MGEFVKVGLCSAFREGRGRVVRVAGVEVAVFRVGGRFFALKDACPHMGASLGDGKLDGSCVVCHWHGWKFDLETGQSSERSWARAAIYDVRVDGEDLLLRAPSPSAPERSEESDEDEDWIFWDAERYFKAKPGAESEQRGADGEKRADQADQQTDEDE